MRRGSKTEHHMHEKGNYQNKTGNNNKYITLSPPIVNSPIFQNNCLLSFLDIIN